MSVRLRPSAPQSHYDYRISIKKLVQALKGSSELSLLLTFVYGLPIGLLISQSYLVVGACCLIAALTSYLTKNAFIFWLLPMISISVISILVEAFWILSPDAELSGHVLIVVFAIVWFLVCGVIRRYNHEFVSKQFVLPLVLFALIFAVFVSRQSWDPVEGFLKITQFGEDNGSWLNNISISSTQNGSKLTYGSGVSGGTLLGVITAMFVEVFQLFKSHAFGFDATGLILWRLYCAFLMFGSTSAIIIIIARVRAKSRLINIVASTIVVVVSISFLLSFVSDGYLTAVIATTWLSSVLALLQLGKIGVLRIQYFTIFLVSSMIIVVGEVWFPMYMITVAVVLLAAISFTPRLRVELRKRNRLKKLGWPESWRSRTLWIGRILIISIALILISEIFLKSGAWSYLSDFENLKTLMGTGGSSGLPVAWSTFIILALLTTMKIKTSICETFEQIIVVAIGGSTVAIMMFSYLYSPYELKYGPSKFAAISAIALFPIAFGLLLGLLNDRGLLSNRSSVALLFVGLLLPTQLNSSLSSLSVLARTPSAPNWFDGVVEARTKFPDRVPLCVNTDVGVGRSEGAYICSRLSIGLVGGERSENEIASALTVFQWANICTVSADTAFKSWPIGFFDKVSIVVSDPTRLSAANDCQSREFTNSRISPFGQVDGLDDWPIGWLSSVKWGTAKVFDNKGEIVTPSFNYLLQNTDTPDIQMVNKLTAILINDK